MTEEKKGVSLFDRVIPLPLVDEIKHSYLDYAMSVIVGRALPDARDGLKPVQRRILYAMMELGLKHNSSYKKSARVVGETMGKYHPHGDSAIYETMVRMAQPFSLRYRLVDGQGNFGSIDGDNPAAMRYTEVRLHEIGELMLADIDEDTVSWGKNFDESLDEPLCLPSKIPNLLINGSSGIAVGMATNIPPHNLSEVVDALLYILDTEEELFDINELLTRLPGPDFPTGGLILGTQGIYDAYTKGRGRIIMRGRMHTEENKRGKEFIVITEIPYMVNKTTLLLNMDEAVQQKHIDGVSEIRDESDRDGVRIVVELSRDGDADLVQRQIYKRTQMQSTFGVINLSLVNNQPLELPMRQTLEIFINHRREIIRRRTQFRLNKALAREHIIEGLVKALDIIDEVISMIRGSQTAAEAKDSLVSKLEFTEIQAQAILEMRLQRLTGLERSKLDEELAQLRADIMGLRGILADAKVLDRVIREELIEINAKFGDERRTEIIAQHDENMSVEDYIPENDIVVVLSKDGYLRRKNLGEYQTQARGGKGRKGAVILEEDAVASVTVTHTHNDVWFFTCKGRILTLKGHLIPETKTGKGKLISRIIPLEEGERVVELHGGELEGLNFGFFITRNGIAKRLEMSEMSDSSRPRRVITLDDGDEIAQVRLTSGENDLLLMTEKAQCLRVCEKEFRAMGRNARGVIGMRIAEGDRVISCDVVDDNRQVLVISEKGVGKRSLFSDYTAHHRGTSGVRAMLLGAKTGKLVGCWSVGEYDEIMAITARGRIIRVAASNVRLLSRMAQGSITMRLDDGDSVVDCSVVRNSSPKVSEDNNEEIGENNTRSAESHDSLTQSNLLLSEDKGS